MPPETINLLQAVPDRAAAEQFVPLLQRDGLLLEQIVSHGQASPEGFSRMGGPAARQRAA